MSHSANLPPKPQVGPSSSKDSQETSKKVRKRKKSSKSVTPNNEAEPVLSSSTNKNGVETFDENGDFIAFSFSDTDDRPEVPETPVREWDRGKRTHEGSYGKKRKAEEMERGDRSGGGKRQRSDNVLKAPWVVDVNWEKCNNVPELLHREVEAFVTYVSPTLEEDQLRSFIVELITREVVKRFPDAKVRPFGSFETKLYLPTGDIDLVIDSDSMAYSNKLTVLRALANTMKRAGITDNVSIIAKAKVPIIKFITTNGRFPVDISINQANGIAAGQMISRFIKEFPALRALVLIIKAFLNQRGMNEVFSGGLGSYSVVCLAVSFLQMHPKIKRGEIDPSKNLGVLIMEFFELYGCFFNYHEVGISIRDGGSYFNKAQRGWLDYGKAYLLSIEDPGDPDNDVSKGTYGIARVRTTFAGAHGILTASAFLHAGIISSRRHGRYTNFRKHTEPEDMSILSSVLGITQETISRRQLVQEVYYTGILQDILGVAGPTNPPNANGIVVDKREAKESIISAWEEAGAEYSSEEDYSRSRYNQGDEDDSRYTRHQRKRPRTSMETVYHAVYTTDDDDEEGGLIEEPVYLDDRRGYDLVGSDGGSLAKKNPTSRRNRDYWLAKGRQVE